MAFSNTDMQLSAIESEKLKSCVHVTIGTKWFDVSDFIYINRIIVNAVTLIAFLMKISLDRERTLEMACLSQLAYVAYNQGDNVVCNILKFGCPSFVQQYQIIEFIHAPRLFNYTDELACCGLLLSTESDVVIAIRGTENLDDYFFNLLALPNSEAIHSGFNFYIESFWQQLRDFLLREDNAKKNIFVTGHSLGGAAATLIAKRLGETNLKPIEPSILETYTFGAPPVSTLKLTLDTPLYRFRNVGDFIPHLPKTIDALMNRIPGLKGAITNWKPQLLQTLADYCHVESEYCIDKNYQIIRLDEYGTANIWQLLQLSKLLVPQLQLHKQTDINNKFQWLIANLIQASLQEHRAIKYVERLSFGKLPTWCQNLEIP